MLGEYDAGYENCIDSMVRQMEDMQFRIDCLHTENVKLRKQYEAVIVDYRAEVAKLRELVGDIWEFGFSNSAGASSVKEWYRVRDELEQRVYAALGVDE